MQGSKLANVQREDGNFCRLFIELAVNWDDYNATLPAYNKDTFSLARFSIYSFFGPILLIIPSLLTTTSTFSLTACAVFFLSAIHL